MHTNQAIVYICAWFSPRGFCNEGVNYYGTLADWRALAATLNDDGDAKWHIASRHRTLTAARAAAEKQVRVTERGTAWGEQNYTSAALIAMVQS